MFHFLFFRFKKENDTMVNPGTTAMKASLYSESYLYERH